MESRVKKTNINIDYQETLHFFNARSKKYTPKHPYTVTSYQDNNPELIEQRNAIEKMIALPLLDISEHDTILDIGCGVGRWADILADQKIHYLGLDFSDSLLQIASNKKYSNKNIFFQKAAVQHLHTKNVSDFLVQPPYTKIIICGLFVYINDTDVTNLLSYLPTLSNKDTKIYLRESISLTERFTLKNFFSSELDTYYNAIYRSVKEYTDLINTSMAKHGFVIKNSGRLLPENLTPYKETTMYYFLLEH